MQTYGLFGFTRFTSDYRVQGTFAREKTKNTGVNLGFGGVFLMDDFWNIMAEFRYATPDGAQDTPSGGSTIVSLGLLYTFD